MPGDDDGVGQVFGFMVGGVLFTAALTGVFALVEGAGTDQVQARTAAEGVDAVSLAALFIGNPGDGWSDPDTLQRFGLADVATDGLDPAHLLLLNDGELDALDNGLLEYEEARAALDLRDVAGFRLKVTALDFELALRQHDFSHVKALYLGDFGSLAPITLTPAEATIATANTRLNESMNANTGLERTVVDSIGVEFDNQVHLTIPTPSIVVREGSPPTDTPLLSHLGVPVHDGDVLYDNKQYLDNVLPDKLATGGYDLLILGSGIDHSTLTANSVKNSIDAFVRAGGTLMVFGSPGGNFNWMQPIMDLSAASVSGAVTAADPDHPVLGLPWDLDWQSYPTNDLAWTIGVPGNFENILMQGGKPVVAVSKDGAIGSGHVFLSSIQPRAVAQGLGNDEAAHFMFNMLLYDRNSIEDPSVVFGPEPPQGVAVSSERRTSQVISEGIAIPVGIDLLVWATP